MLRHHRGRAAPEQQRGRGEGVVRARAKGERGFGFRCGDASRHDATACDGHWRVEQLHLICKQPRAGQSRQQTNSTHIAMSRKIALRESHFCAAPEQTTPADYLDTVHTQRGHRGTGLPLWALPLWAFARRSRRQSKPQAIHIAMSRRQQQPARRLHGCCRVTHTPESCGMRRASSQQPARQPESQQPDNRTARQPDNQATSSQQPAAREPESQTVRLDNRTARQPGNQATSSQTTSSHTARQPDRQPDSQTARQPDI
ncbi:hypothetical protein PMIN03_010885 [Paraphaeosphaeria minitans]